LTNWIDGLLHTPFESIVKGKKNGTLPSPLSGHNALQNLLGGIFGGRSNTLRVIKSVLGGFSQNIFSIFHKQSALALLLLLFSSSFYLVFKFLCGGEICCLLKHSGKVVKN
jgi:hypothetical protein